MHLHIVVIVGVVWIEWMLAYLKIQTLDYYNGHTVFELLISGIVFV